MKRTQILMAVLAATSIVSIAGAGVYSALTLKRVVKEGDRITFTVKGELEVGGQAVTLAGKSYEKVLKVDADRFTIESGQTDTKVSVGGQEMAQPDSTETEIKLLTGQTVELKGERTQAESYRLSNLNSFIFPDKEINIGDKWTAKFAANEKTGAVDATTEFKYVADEKVGEWDTIKVEAVAKETKDSTAEITSTFWVNKADGSLVRMISKLKDVMMAGVPAPLNGTIEQKREG